MWCQIKLEAPTLVQLWAFTSCFKLKWAVCLRSLLQGCIAPCHQALIQQEPDPKRPSWNLTDCPNKYKFSIGLLPLSSHSRKVVISAVLTLDWFHKLDQQQLGIKVAWLSTHFSSSWPSVEKFEHPCCKIKITLLKTEKTVIQEAAQKVRST